MNAILSVGFWSVLSIAGVGSNAGKPNIVFILADDLGYGDLGCYGQKRIKTPNIDTLAKDGVLFTSCYAGSTVCAPSRCALMTGMHTGHCRVRGNANVPLRPEDKTVAELLKSAGYNTALVGKWGLGEAESTGTPNRKGFDYFFGYLNQKHAHNYYPDFLWRNDNKVSLANVQEGGVASVAKEYAPDLLTQEAMGYIDRQSADKPFFLYLAYTTPHANNERGKQLKDGMEVPDLGEYVGTDWPRTEKAKAAMISRLDSDVGKVLSKIAEKGLADNTVIFFTSDNGPHREGGAVPAFHNSSGPLRGIKRDLYEGGIRVPMIVRWPDVLEPNRKVDAPWASWDVLPTCKEVAGIDWPARFDPKSLDGISMLGIAKGEKPEPRTFYWEFHEGGFTQALRWGDWKFIRKSDGTTELYSLDRDLSESKNLAGTQPEIEAKLRALIRTERTDSPDWPIQGTKKSKKGKKAKQKKLSK